MVSRVKTWVANETLTASDLNTEFNTIISAVGSGTADHIDLTDVYAWSGAHSWSAATTHTNTVTVGVNDTGHDVKFFGATSGQYMLWDESADELVLAGDTKLSFHDAAGGENIIATSNGHLEINAGTTLDITAPTVDLNSSTEFNIDTAAYDLNASGAVTIDSAGVSIDSSAASNLTTSGGALTITSAAAATWSTAAGALTLGSGAAINITPASGSVILLDGTISVDAGVVTGATAITLSGELDAGSLDISGDADIDGTLEADAITIGSTAIGSIYGVVAGSSSIVTVGTIGTGTWQGTAIAASYVATLNQDTTGTAALATTVTITDNESTNETNALIFTAGGDVDGGDLGLESDGNLTYNPSSGLLSSTAVNTGALTATGAFTSLGIDDNSGSVMFTIDSSLRGIMGHTSTLYGHRLELVSTEGQGLGIARFSAADTANALDFMKSKSDSVGTNTLVAINDQLGSINWRGANGTGWDVAASIKALVDGTPGSSSDMPGRLAFYTTGDNSASPLERVRIDSAGNVGIGPTPSPDYFLHVNSGASPGENQLQVQANAAGGFSVLTYAADNTYLLFDAEYVGDAWKSLDAGSNFYIQKGSDKLTIASETGVAVNETISAWDSLLTITSAGNVGIGTASPAHKLDVVGTAGLSTGTAWTDTSDSRIKTNVQTITGALSKIKQLRPISFKYIDQYLSVHPEIDGSKTYNSFIADEYENVFPDAVSAEGDLVRIIDKETNEKEILLEKLKQYTPTDLPTYLVAAMQELATRLEALELSQ